jgi:hypothetical protein
VAAYSARLSLSIESGATNLFVKCDELATALLRACFGAASILSDGASLLRAPDDRQGTMASIYHLAQGSIVVGLVILA